MATRTKRQRFGQAFRTFSELMAAPDPNVDDLSIFIIPFMDTDTIYARATSYAQAMDAACKLIFGQARKMSDRDKFEEARKSWRA